MRLEIFSAIDLINKKFPWSIDCWLPYGKWTCESGREVLFNRDYTPKWERSKAGEITKPANPNEWISGIVKEEYFYAERTAPYKRFPHSPKDRLIIGNVTSFQKCLRILDLWGVLPT
jgi:hypothetical protein